MIREIRNAGLIESLAASLVGLEDFVNPFFIIQQNHLINKYKVDNYKSLLSQVYLPNIKPADLFQNFSPAELNLFYSLFPEIFSELDFNLLPFIPIWRNNEARSR